MAEKEVDLQEILKELRNIIGDQAQQIAMLRAAVSMLNSSNTDSATEGK
jgi:hypothetical protein